MKETKIVVDIDSAGALSIEASGFEGDACLKQLESLLEGLASAPQTVVRKAGGPPQQSLQSHQLVGGKK